MTDSQTRIRDFAKKYSYDGWTLKKEDGIEYATLERRILPFEFNDETIFATYYIDTDEVFRVPVISASFFTETGHRLSHEELLSLVPEKLDLSAISEREHPATGKPVFFIHPCKTDEFIMPFVNEGADYMMVWIVRYGPIFFYRLPNTHK